MSLSEKLQAELAPAMKARERSRVGVIRLIKAALKNKEIEKAGPSRPKKRTKLCRRWSNSVSNR